jgi:NADH:ubiquinone oxidoreductase subunit F (NADH-binding)
MTTTETWPRRLFDGLPAEGTSDIASHHAQWGPLPPLDPAEIINMVERSGLLGRGGAGFPTGRKMRTVAAGSRRAVVVANGAEGEPASGKDKLLLARVPHLVLDGIALAARAVNAGEAHLVVHGGGRLAASLRREVAARRGDGVAVQVHELPARYVASEESAIVHWLNGGESKPTFTPPRPFEQGVGRRPTLINNVETLAHVATLVRRGDDWFRAVGDVDEPGTLLVTVSGDRVDRRVAEVPTGTTIGAVASRAGLDLSASLRVLVGGYFGTWLPTDYATQLPLTHRALRSAGAALGAGVVAALPSDRCGVVETARVASYLAGHNAGQCGPCLNGLPAIAGALRDLASGTWDDRRWPMLERWLAVVPGRGACRHPDGAVRFVATALSTFAADVARHRSGQVCAHAAGAAWLPVPRPATGWR